MADWVRRDYDAVGVTQHPAGRHLAALQEPFIGKVLLCIDVSGSMAGKRLRHAVAGARTFVAEAVANRYRTGLVLWNDRVAAHVPLTAKAGAVLRALSSARAHGGTDVTPALELGIRELGPLVGDRVLAVFGDGDIGDVEVARATARRAAELGIRIVVRGLGEHAAAQLSLIATEGVTAPETLVRSESGIEAGVASMIKNVLAGITRRRG